VFNRVSGMSHGVDLPTRTHWVLSRRDSFGGIRRHG